MGTLLSGNSVTTGSHADSAVSPIACGTATTRLSGAIMGLAVIGIIILMSSLWSKFPINQDEFSHLSRVYAHSRGELAIAVQTLHVHFFKWLRFVSDNELVQVQAARFVMGLFFLGTCACMVAVGSYLLGLSGAVLSLLCYLSLAFVLPNAASFRPDTIATFLFLFALYQFYRGEGRQVSGIVAGVSMALACTFTIKAGLYLPVFAGLFIARFRTFRAMARWTLAFLLSFVATVVPIYLVHSTTADAPSSFPRSFGGLFDRYFVYPFHPHFHSQTLLYTLRSDSLTWALLLAGLVLSLSRVIRNGAAQRRSEADLLALFSPAIFILFFRNTYPYFYVFILPTAMFLCANTYTFPPGRARGKLRRLVPLLVTWIALCICAQTMIRGMQIFKAARRVYAAQYELLSTVHRMFSEPVPYMDGCDMVSSFPKVGFFMASINMRPYLEAGAPFLKNQLLEKQPVFLLANVPHLDLHAEAPPESSSGLAVLPEDWEALKSYFIHHWGTVWVAGKRLELSGANAQQQFTIFAEGLYTVEAEDTKVLIDGRPYHDGDVLRLGRGGHTMEAEGAEAIVVLRWGDHLYRPADPPTNGGLFLGILS